MTRAWTEIGDSVARAGCRKLIFMNSHGGNVPVIDAVARELRVRHRMLAVHAAWHRLGFPEGMFSAKERAHGIHGGDAETSLMLAFRPETVNMERGERFRERGGRRSSRSSSSCASRSRSASAGWRATCTQLGAAGDASNATAEKGEALAESGAEEFIDLLRDVLAFDLARLRPGPLARK